MIFFYINVELVNIPFSRVCLLLGYYYFFLVLTLNKTYSRSAVNFYLILVVCIGKSVHCYGIIWWYNSLLSFCNYNILSKEYFGFVHCPQPMWRIPAS